MKKGAKGRLYLNFNFTLMQAVCDNIERFNNDIGYIVRKHCSFWYKEWMLVPPEVRALLRDCLLISNNVVTIQCFLIYIYMYYYSNLYCVEYI